MYLYIPVLMLIKRSHFEIMSYNTFIPCLMPPNSIKEWSACMLLGENVF